MSNYNIYKDIASRTNGDIYVGVVGPVRTGKSTFINRFMECLVLDKVGEGYPRERARDELPQSADGRTIMTTEPKFVPSEAIPISIDNADARIRMIDCVGYLIDGALGGDEEGAPRMVKTPWSDQDLPFERAAEIGTDKVVREHSTVGVVVTTDGTIGDISRGSYVEAEERVIKELKAIGKPFTVVLNTATPNSPDTIKLAESLSKDSNWGSKDDIDEFEFLKDKAFFLMIKNGKISLAHLIPPLYKETVDLANKLIGENFFVLKDD
ncbi:MAG: 50S ribosome-binding GTPase, partial [Clostridia bacterium]|nr:50S ribosome-binding GTPase [Clostridia bacterium]